ncbi:tyrosine-type recombinase/integrase [Flavobacterium sp. GCM10023249]|uniref:tyrosine-type recombinase/integrase n=1 Tax=unclassified Flavobacterium TaxID=196869 RepID=UPI00361B7081
MAKIQFKLNTKKEVGNLNMRLYHGEINCYAPSNIFVENICWSNTTNSLKQRVDLEIREDINQKIKGISDFIFEKFYPDYAKGELIDSKWLKKRVDEFYKRPTGVDDFRYYFVPFIDNFIKNSTNRVNPLTNKIIAENTIKAYKTTLARIVEFQDKEGITIKTKDIDLNFHQRFTAYLSVEKEYGGTVIEKYVRHVKQFVREAKSFGYETSSEIESKNFTYQRSTPIDTYLNETEIDKIFSLDLSQNLELRDSHHLFIIGLWTGLRLGDLIRFDQFKIIKDRIVITATDKTGEKATIPLHYQVKEVLEARGNRPFVRVNEVKFNKDIKIICKLAGINEVMVGRKRVPGKNRKVKSYYPKYELISSHTCRRSFVTNHYGKIDDKTIMAITTHKSYNQFMKYIKTTTDESASKMEELWRNSLKSKGNGK